MKDHSLDRDVHRMALRQAAASVPEAVRTFLSAQGAKGGRAKSEAKTAAARLNAAKPRPRKPK
jgi:hypothetical protein